VQLTVELEEGVYADLDAQHSFSALFEEAGKYGSHWLAKKVTKITHLGDVSVVVRRIRYVRNMTWG
jgi:hypothetical protein